MSLTRSCPDSDDLQYAFFYWLTEIRQCNKIPKYFGNSQEWWKWSEAKWRRARQQDKTCRLWKQTRRSAASLAVRGLSAESTSALYWSCPVCYLSAGVTASNASHLCLQQWCIKYTDPQVQVQVQVPNFYCKYMSSTQASTKHQQQQWCSSF